MKSTGSDSYNQRQSQAWGQPWDPRLLCAHAAEGMKRPTWQFVPPQNRHTIRTRSGHEVVTGGGPQWATLQRQMTHQHTALISELSFHGLHRTGYTYKGPVGTVTVSGYGSAESLCQLLHTLLTKNPLQPWHIKRATLTSTAFSMSKSIAQLEQCWSSRSFPSFLNKQAYNMTFKVITDGGRAVHMSMTSQRRSACILISSSFELE